MRNLPIDTNRLVLIGTGKAAARAEYVEATDAQPGGERRNVRSGNQERDKESGLPMWVVDCLVDDDDPNARAVVVGVKIASAEEPRTAKWQPVRFRNLTANVYTGRDGRPALSFRADGIENAAAPPKAA
jgi:hypothetical protein